MRRVRPEEPYKINELITATHVRVVGENVKVDIYPINQAIRIAEDLGLDLVEISPKADPPVCKVIDYSSLSMIRRRSKRRSRQKPKRLLSRRYVSGPIQMIMTSTLN